MYYIFELILCVNAGCTKHEELYGNHLINCKCKNTKTYD